MLAIAPSWVGDAILSEPLFARIRGAGVEVPIDVIAPPWCGPVYARVRGIGRIIDSPAAHGEFAWHRRRALGIALRAARYTHAYVLPNTWKSALVPWFAQVPRRIGYRGEARYRLLTDARRLDRQGLPQLVARYAALAVPRGEPAPAPAPPKLVPDADNLARAMHALGLSREKPIAVLCPGAEFGPAKRWPAEHFADLARRLARDGFAVWIMGSPNDAAVASALVGALGADVHVTTDLTGRTDLGTAIDLMSVARLVVSNDSGLMHAAAAVGAPLVALFGSSSPLYTPPLSASARIARIEIACSPCFKRECPLGHFRCMRELHPELVYNLAREPTPSAASVPPADSR
ncbi:MAG TPA: lipopolysaccharide heptosyltransferase II [Casimicrobiaceae bacterium]|nr:lipopolysaccharide heptosyltransferase II [Casimicrobiaceae bacterium]